MGPKFIIEDTWLLEYYVSIQVMSSREVRHPLLHPEAEEPSVQFEENHQSADAEENVEPTKVVIRGCLHVYNIGDSWFSIQGM